MRVRCLVCFVVILLVVVAMAGVAFAIATVVAVALAGAARAPCCTAFARLPADDVIEMLLCKIIVRWDWRWVRGKESSPRHTRSYKAEHNKQHGTIGAH